MNEQSGGITVFIGTYTRGTRSEGIYVHRFDPESGALAPASVVSGAENPSFLALHPGGRFLYAASEVESFGGRAQGAIYAYAVDARDGRLTFLNARGSVGRGPCHVSVDAAGRWLLAANYHGGSVCAMPIEPDGRLAPASDFVQHTGTSVNPERQDQAHAHSINLDPRNRFAYVPDLGQDKIVIYKPNSERGALIPNALAAIALPPGSGPRHFAFAPNANRAYAINELASTITAFERDAESGALHAFQTISTLPADFADANTTADIHVHPSGKFVYGSNRGHDSVGDVRGERIGRTPDGAGSSAHARTDAAQLRHRPVGQVSARRQPGQRYDNIVRHRRGFGDARAHGGRGGSCGAGVRGVWVVVGG